MALRATRPHLSISAAISLLNAAGATLTLIANGMVLSRSVASLYGQYIGWTISGTDAPYRIQAIQLEVVPTREWNVRQ